MASNELVDAQFDRAVEIVQSLPKNGAIQTDYEEKLTMYSLYKQATIGNVKSPRPGIWDMLGRAKWDAWDKHKNLDSYEAKWLYVDALLRVLRKYSDKTYARSLVEELESYGGDPSNLVMSRSLSRSHDSDSSSESSSEGHPSPLLDRHIVLSNSSNVPRNDEAPDEAAGDEVHDLPNVPSNAVPHRPGSSLSTHRYRTPTAGSLAMSPPPPLPLIQSQQQPMPRYETPSAFADPSHTSLPSSMYPATTLSELSNSPNIYQTHAYSHSLPENQYGPINNQPIPRITLERAMEHMQGQLAAMTERLEAMESARYPARSNFSANPRGLTWARNGQRLDWDWEDMGMWSLVITPALRGLDYLRDIAAFFAKDEARSPSSVVVRRLCLDVSFFMCVVGILKLIWRKSGVRRREVLAALVVLYRAILGIKPPRSLVDRGV